MIGVSSEMEDDMNDRIFNLRLKIEITPPYESTDCWTFMFPEINVGSQGETPEVAAANGIEALSLWFEICVAHGSLEKVLQSHGIDQSRVHSIEEGLRSCFLPSFGKEYLQCQA